MPNPFRLGDNIFVHADAVCRLTPTEGGAKGKPFTVRACSKLELKFNGKSVTAKGNSIIPVAIALAEAEPSFSIGLDVAQVSVDYAEWCGDGYLRMPHGIVVTCTRPGLAPVSFKLRQAIIENGFGFSSDAGNQAKDEISGKMRELILNYKGKDYNPFALPGGTLTL